MAQSYEKLVQEDLNVGTENVWVSAPERGKLLSTQVGIHTFARGQQAYEDSWTPGAIAAGSKASTTIAVPDAETSDIVLAAHSKVLTNALIVKGHISSAGDATIVLHNPTSASITVPAGTMRVIAFPFRSNSDAITVYFTWNQPAEDVSVTFTAVATDVTNPSYEWDFGDTNTSTDNPAIHGLYPQASDTYLVTLTVTGDEGVFQDSAYVTTDYDNGQSGSSQ